MTAVDFPDIPCTFATEVTQTPRTLEATYGNGYAQRVGDGLNTMPEVWSVVWEGIAWTDCVAIKTFLKARGGTEPFNWTPPGESALQVKCSKGWKRTKTSGTTGNFSTVFEEVFDL